MAAVGRMLPSMVAFVGLISTVMSVCCACIMQVCLGTMLHTSPVFRFRWKSRSRFRMWLNRSRLMRLRRGRHHHWWSAVHRDAHLDGRQALVRKLTCKHSA